MNSENVANSETMIPENVFGNKKTRTLHEGKSADEAPAGHQPSRRPLQTLPRENFKRSSQSPSLHFPNESKQHVRRALLRYGEDMETLFGISSEQQISQAYIDDCKQLVETEEDHPSVWRRVLHYASHNPTAMSEAELVRLHRRATTRIPAPSPTVEYDEQEFENVLSIWLSYARAQKMHGRDKEAMLTLTHVRGWAAHKASLYLQLSELHHQNNNLEEAVNALREGIRHHAQPESDLRQALARLEPQPDKKRKQQDKPLRKQADQTLSPKRLKTESGKIDIFPTPPEPRHDEDMSVGSRKESIRFRLGPLPGRTSAGERKPPAVTQDSADTQGDESRRNASMTGKSTPARSDGDSQKVRSRSTASKARRPPLAMSKLGKARRVDPAATNCDDSDDNCDDAPYSSTETLGDSKVAAVNMDLSYILEWDPNKRFSGDEKVDDRVRAEVNEPKVNPSPQLPKIDEARALATPHTPSPAEDVPYQNISPSRERSFLEAASIEKQVPMARRKQKDQASHEFLHLIDEKNIIQVNETGYVKLGAPVGKGGSCKVYRALAKDYSVVAIKKVKLAGMDKKAIESYANEINLLKSLRGSSTIIQLFDSEVDLKRKAIFVVMELGEADLNHVLQKQAIASDGGRCLNMNFIRLTWQQMLSAVHCIHENRIIHGDLKPANFLFVKGTLKLIDFGIAKAIENLDTTNIYRESQVGTLNYMSPEAIMDSGHSVDKPTMKIGRASDIWSLGCILYQMVYGKTPFAELHMIQKLQAIINPNHAIKFPDTADPLAMDVMKLCLQRRPELRPPIVGRNGLLSDHPFLVTQRIHPRHK